MEVSSDCRFLIFICSFDSSKRTAWFSAIAFSSVTDLNGDLIEGTTWPSDVAARHLLVWIHSADKSEQSFIRSSPSLPLNSCYRLSSSSVSFSLFSLLLLFLFVFQSEL